MIRYASIEDKETISILVSGQNKKSKYHSFYMSNNEEMMKRDILQSILEKCVLVHVEKEDINGVIFFTQYSKTKPIYDVSGPYVKNENMEIAESLLNKAKLALKSGSIMNFFFESKSNYYLQLMDQVGSKFNQYEFLLSLKKENLNFITGNNLDIHLMERDEKEAVKKLHSETFPDIYIDAEKVVKSKYIYVLKKQTEVIGYALQKIQDTQNYLEVFAIKMEYRGNGLSKPFLSYVLGDGFEKSKHDVCKLIVDLDNDKAVNLYIDLGFVIESKNSSYHLVVE